LAEIEPMARSLRLVEPDRIDEPHIPPPGLNQAILDAVHRERPTERGRRITRMALAAAVAAVAGGLVGYAVAPRPAEPPLESLAVNVLEPSVESTAEVIPHAWGIEIKLAGRGFDSGVAYRVFVRRVTAAR
jgi:hypothetical protein